MLDLTLTAAYGALLSLMNQCNARLYGVYGNWGRAGAGLLRQLQAGLSGFVNIGIGPVVALQIAEVGGLHGLGAPHQQTRAQGQRGGFFHA